MKNNVNRKTEFNKIRDRFMGKWIMLILYCKVNKKWIFEILIMVSNLELKIKRF